MCYHVSSKSAIPVLEKRFKAKLKDDPYDPYYHANGFSYPKLPIIANNDPDSIQLFNWGLIPFWVKDEESAKKLKTMTLNAMSETAHEKPSFRDSLKNKRCLVLIDGFFEWQHEGKIKTPYYIKLKEDKPFAAAGLWSEWAGKETGEMHKTFSILTTEANPLMAEIHNSKKRMPLILNEETERLWIDNEVNPDELKKLMAPYDQDKMTAYKVSPNISKRGYYSNIPEILEPV